MARPVLAVNRIRPAYEQVADQLRALVLDGRLAPGDRFPVEADLAASFGVSRGTVREALRVLASRNLIYSVRGASGGTFVAEGDRASISEYLETGIGLLSSTEAISVDELLEARHLLEVPAARLASERGTEEHIEAMRVSLAHVPDGTGPDGLSAYHQQFHTLVLAASQNRLLELMTLPVFGVIRTRFVISPADKKSWRQVEADHEEIFQAIAGGDGDRAAETMHEHLVRLNVIYKRLAGKPARLRAKVGLMSE